MVKKAFSSKFNKYICEIFAGGYYATREKNIIITTLLGSCVAACLRDRESGVVGMNHFMLPGDFSRQEVIVSPSAKYGMYAMEMLINAMMKLGANRDRLEAKIFGGGHVLETGMNRIPDSNVAFIKAYLSMENIPVVAEDLGGNMGRKIMFFTDTTHVYLKRIVKDHVYHRDKKFISQVRKKGEKSGDITLFE